MRLFILQCYGEGLWSERRAGNFKKRTEKFKKEKRIGSLKVMDKIKKKYYKGLAWVSKMSQQCLRTQSHECHRAGEFQGHSYIYFNTIYIRTEICMKEILFHVDLIKRWMPI